MGPLVSFVVLVCFVVNLQAVFCQSALGSNYDRITSGKVSECTVIIIIQQLLKIYGLITNKI